MVLESVDV